VRAAAVADFLQDLRAHGSADLNALLSTLNDGALVREALGHWIGNGWIAVAPHSPLLALAGPAFTRKITLAQFCGQPAPQEPEGEDAVLEEEAPSDDNP
jgi:hypothetical protein